MVIHVYTAWLYCQRYARQRHRLGSRNLENSSASFWPALQQHAAGGVCCGACNVGKQAQGCNAHSGLPVPGQPCQPEGTPNLHRLRYYVRYAVT